MFGNRLHFDTQATCVDAPYFDAPGTLEAPLGCALCQQNSGPADGAPTAAPEIETGLPLLPPVTMVFCGVDGGFKGVVRAGAPPAAVRAMHGLLRECVLRALRYFPGSYLTRDQEADLRFLMAFSSPEVRFASTCALRRSLGPIARAMKDHAYGWLPDSLCILELNLQRYASVLLIFFPTCRQAPCQGARLTASWALAHAAAPAATAGKSAASLPTQRRIYQRIITTIAHLPHPDVGDVRPTGGAGVVPGGSRVRNVPALARGHPVMPWILRRV